MDGSDYENKPPTVLDDGSGRRSNDSYHRARGFRESSQRSDVVDASGSLLRVVKRPGQMTELVGLRRGKLYYPFLG